MRLGTQRGARRRPVRCVVCRSRCFFFFVFGLVVAIVSLKQSSVPAGLALLSSSASSVQVALVAFLLPSPWSWSRLSSGAKVPAKGALRPAVLIRVGLSLSNSVNCPTQLAGPEP